MPLNVLLVDDSAVMRKMIIRSLRQAGIDVADALEASNGVEALASLEKRPVDLVLCDWNMPEMSGIEFLKEARKKHQTPIVMLTTESATDRVSEALTAGADGYITKPFTPDKLNETLSIVLNR